MKAPAGRKRPWGALISLHRRDIRVSELMVIVVLLVTAASLLTLLTRSLLNEQTLRIGHQNIAREQALRIRLDHEYDELRDCHRIARTLRVVSRGKLTEPTLYQLASLVQRSGRTYGYDPFLVLAVIQVESVFDSAAVGRYQSGAQSGAWGLMQLKLETAREVARDLGITVSNESDLFIPEVNVALGLAYLTRLIARFRNLRLGILAYNMGPGFVRQSMSGAEVLPERYYNKVLRAYYHLQGIRTDESID